MCPAVPTMMWGIGSILKQERLEWAGKHDKLGWMIRSRRCPRPILIALVGAWSAVTGPAAQTAAPDVSRVIGSASFQEAKAFIRADYDRFVKELVALTEIPAPPFKEERRATAYL